MGALGRQLVVRERKPKGSRLRARNALCTAACAAACFVALGVFAAPAQAADGPNLHAVINQLTNNQLTNGLGIDLPKPTLPPVNVSLPHVNVPTDPSSLVSAVTSSLLPSNASASGSSASPTPPEAAVDQTASAPPRGSQASAPRLVTRGELRSTGPTAVLHLARSATVLLVLVLGAIGFLVVQSHTERRNPRLASAPIDRRDSELEFR